MWFRNTKKKEKRSLKKEINTPPQISTIVEHQGTEKLHENNAVLRFWLPEEAKQAMEEAVRCNKTTTARYLRELFVVYLYGEHSLQQMRQQSTGLYYVPPPAPDSGIRYSISMPTTIDTVAELGKSIIPVKLYLPQKIKDDLQLVADATETSLSTFIREVLISHLFGHVFLHEKLRIWSPEEEAVGNQWGEDDEEELTVAVEEEEWEVQGEDRNTKIIKALS